MIKGRLAAAMLVQRSDKLHRWTMHISVTRLRLGSWLTAPAFAWGSLVSARQAKASPGYVKGRLLADRGRVFWTLTAWDSAEAMKAFRNGGAHAGMAPKLADWCTEASVAQWDSQGDALPDWPEAYGRMTRQGRASRVKRPTAAHAALAFAPPATDVWRDRPL
jgi:hypothetical protein